jgi:acetyltransferase-like isoleucine patch superfamily enzyme
MNVWHNFLKIWWKLTIPKRLAFLGVKFGKNCTFYGMPIVDMYPGSSIRIGDGVVLCSHSKFTALGVNHPVILKTLSENAHINIGNNTGISGGSICSFVSINIGCECLIGANVMIADTDFHALKYENRRFNNDQNDINSAEVVIENNVFIGTNSYILKGVVIRENSVVGANSVVTKSITNNKIFAGNPARFISDIV